MRRHGRLVDLAAMTRPLSVWPTAQQTSKTQRAGRYLASSIAHPAKMLPAIARHAITAYTHSGELQARRGIRAQPGRPQAQEAQVNYLHYPLGQVNTGVRVRITLSRQANVYLLDGTNYHRYRRREAYRGIGGRQLVSPAELTVPHAGHWHVVVNLGGASGQLRAKVQLLRASAGVGR